MSIRADEHTIVAPFTPEQVEALNVFQASGVFHPFTCRDRDDHPDVNGEKGLLVARSDGWHCPHCGYRQTWAHRMMADKAGIERALAHRKELLGRAVR